MHCGGSSIVLAKRLLDQEQGQDIVGISGMLDMVVEDC
jgi:hypothetical protein